MRRTRPVSERIERRTEPEPNTGCWLWTGAVDRHGYGQIRINKRTYYVTRVVLGLPLHGAWHLCACHRCDNPPCVNPAHLFIGTRAENQQDMARKGRAGPRTRGAEHRSAKLTDLDVLRAREVHALGFNSRELASLYGVHHSTLDNIFSGKTWRHV